jgi:hypothetical protein
VKAHRFPPERKFIKLPATWLNKGSWKDEVAAAPNGPANGAGARTLEDWRRLLILYPAKRLRDWNRDRLGPPPGSPGCEVPAELIRELVLPSTGDCT